MSTWHTTQTETTSTLCLDGHLDGHLGGHLDAHPDGHLDGHLHDSGPLNLFDVMCQDVNTNSQP